jgi:transcriptional regulator with XRE-family HTH domain
MKERVLEGFGLRLRDLRLASSLTQEELGQRVGVSQRVIAYYEQEGAQPPGALLVDLAKALRVSADELLGLKSPNEQVSPKIARLRKRLRRVETLPPEDQKSVLKLVDLLVQNQRIKNGR